MAVLARWRAPSTAQGSLQASFIDHLRRHPDGLSRQCHPDHLTASALVVSEDRTQVLLNLHRKYRIWVQFGGHFETADATLADAARREATEESGIEGLQLLDVGIVQLSRHEVRCGPIQPAHHLDVRFVAVAPAGSAVRVSDESLDVRWFPRDQLPADVEPELLELIDTALLL